MKEKFKTHFLQFGPRRFVVFTVLALVLTDLVNFYYLKLYWMSKDFSNLIVRMGIMRSGQMMENFSADSIQEMMALITNCFYFFLFIILVNNLFFYLFYLRRKLWAQGFVLFYVLTAAIFQMTFIFDNGGLSWTWTTYNLLTVPFYLYLFFGVKWLKAETTDAVPLRGKMAQ